MKKGFLFFSLVILITSQKPMYAQLKVNADGSVCIFRTGLGSDPNDGVLNLGKDANDYWHFTQRNDNNSALALHKYLGNNEWNSYLFTIDTTGKVGIGISSPTEKLEVYGNTRISGSDHPYITLTPTSALAWWTIQNDEATFKIGDVPQGQTPSVINPRLTIKQDGNIGINTINPTVKIDVNGAIALRDSTPPILTSTVHNYPIGNYSLLRLGSTVSVTITGFAGGTQGKVLWVINVGNNTIVLANQNTSSYAQNRIIGNVSLAANSTSLLWYDSTTQRWRILK